MNLLQLSEEFKELVTVYDYFENVRWGNKINCPICGHDRVSKRYANYQRHCPKCRGRFSVTTNTYLHDTRMSLKRWLFAFAVISDAKKGISALQLQRNLGIHYESAWSMYHRIREIMQDGERELDGIVEMDETYVGGKPRKYQSAKYGIIKPNPELDKRIKELKEDFDFSNNAKPKKALTENAPRGRGTSKTPVVGIVKRNGDVVAEVMQNTGAKELKEMVLKHVDIDNSVLLTDEYKGYKGLEKVIEHIKIDHSKYYSYKGLNTNSIESFWAIIKRGIMGQFHQVSVEYLPKYVDEFCFKYNNRKHDDMFETLVFNSMLPKAKDLTEIYTKKVKIEQGKERARHVQGKQVIESSKKKAKNKVLF
jgi:transposase-like protein